MNSTRNRLLFLIVCAGLCTIAFAQDVPQPLTLREAVQIALARNPEVLIAQAQLDELLGRITEVRSGAFPQMNMEGYGLRLRDPSFLNSSAFDHLPPEFRDSLVPTSSNLFDVGVTVKQPIYNAGKVRNAIRLADETKKEKQQTLEAARQRTAFRVLQAFNDLLLAQENQGVVTETLQQRQKHLDLARARFSQGVATEIDVLRSEVNVANVEPEIIRASNRIRLSRSVLNNLIVTDIDAPTRIAGRLEHRPLSVEELSDLLGGSLSARPEIMAARQVVEESKILLALARAENKLGVDFTGRIGLSVRDLKNFVSADYRRWNVTLNFTLPFYDGGRKAGLIVQAGAREKAAEQNLTFVEKNVRLEVIAARDDLQSSAQAIAAARLNVTQAEKVLGMMQANYQYGAATTLDVVDSQTALTLARNALINATYDYEMAKARLRLATGNPVLDREVKLP